MVGVATAYVQPLIGAAGDVHAAFPTTDPEGNGVVIVTLGRLFDDSVREVRYVLQLEQRDDGSWRPVGASWEQRCHERPRPPGSLARTLPLSRRAQGRSAVSGEPSTGRYRVVSGQSDR